MKHLATTLLLAAWIAFPVAAQATEGREEGEEFPIHHVSVLVGHAVEDEHDDRQNSDYALGVDYEYRFRRLLGVGGLLEFVEGETTRERLLLGVLNVHFYKGFRGVVAAGGEIDQDRHRTTVFRLGLAYEFELGKRWTLAPDVSVDVVSGGRVVYVYGVAVGREF